jgi:hypothetical protein
MFKNRFLLVLGLLSLLLVAMAVSRTPAKAPTSAKLSWPHRPMIGDLSLQRGRVADSARLTAIGEYYQALAVDEAARQRSQEADTARWTAMAEYYQNIEVHRTLRSREANALRWTSMTKYFLQAMFKGR